MGTIRSVLTVLAGAALALPALGASDYYLKIEGVKGEIAAPPSEVVSWSWGLSQGGSAGSTKGGTARVQAPVAAPGAPVTAPRDAASGMATGKRTATAAGDLDGDGAADLAAAEPQTDAVNEVTLRLRESPTLPRSLRQDCAAGTHFGSVELGGKGKRYRMQDAVVTSCTVADGMRTVELKGHVTLIK